MQRAKSRHELRCFCSRRPILAFYGMTEYSKLYVHVKVYKQSRIYGEVIIEGGVVRLHCRECLRWHKVKITQSDTASLEEDLQTPAIFFDAAVND